MTITVVVADDQSLVRAGFRMILEADPDLRIVAEACDGSEAVEASRHSRPDVVLMDIRMPVMDGLEATRRIMKLPDPPRVLILTTYDTDEYVFEAIVIGASGFLLKDTAPEDLLSGIRTIANGDSLLSPSVTRRLIEAFVQDHPTPATPPAGLQSLTERELQILQLLARGLSNAEIAEELYLSSATIKTHVARVLDKLGVRDRVQAVVVAYETGVVRPGAAG
ncbi:MAG TPA: response regulator transcription factor [Acidimicrobiales bacterium]